MSACRISLSNYQRVSKPHRSFFGFPFVFLLHVVVVVVVVVAVVVVVVVVVVTGRSETYRTAAAAPAAKSAAAAMAPVSRGMAGLLVIWPTRELQTPSVGRAEATAG